jgi:nitrite reductase/ring-hydroxylating ferredoxin subunit
MEFVRVARVDEIPAGEARVLGPAGFRALLTRLGNEIHALQPTCPHRGCDWDGARLDGELVTCPRCGFRYSVRTGLNPLTTACHVNQSTAEYHYRHFPEGHARRHEVRVAGEEVAVATQAQPFRKVIT